MPVRFFDTSAFFKRYHTEPGTATVNALVTDPDPNHIARLGLVEFHSALAKKVRMSPPQLTPVQAGTAEGAFRTDVTAGLFRLRRMTPGHDTEAIRLIRTYGHTLPLRTLDALQLAVALSLRPAFPGLELVSGDTTVVAVATREGLPAVLV